MFWKIFKTKPKEISPSTKQQENRIADALSSLTYTIAHESDTNRKQDRSEDNLNRYISIATLVFVICTTVGIFIQACILRSTDKAMQKSAKASEDSASAALQQSNLLVSEQRPWVSFTNLEYSGDLTFDQNGANIGVTFKLANTGHTPAIGAEISFNPFIVRDGFMDKIKKFEVVTGNGYFGDVIFPGESPITYGSSGNIPRAEIDEIEKGKSRILDLMIQLCAVYQFPFAETPVTKRHKTCSTIQVSRTRGILLIIPDPEVHIPKSNLFGQFEIGGSYAD